MPVCALSEVPAGTGAALMPVWAGFAIFFGCVLFLAVALWATGWMLMNAVCRCREAGRVQAGRKPGRP